MTPGNRPKAIRRTASDLRSSATTRPGQLPHKTHMRLVCLEMERHRKQQECQTLIARAQRCKERCAEIDVEVRSLMAILDRTRNPETSQSEIKPNAPLRTAVQEEIKPMFHSY